MEIALGIVVVVVVVVAAALLLGVGSGFRAEGRNVDAWRKSWGPGDDVEEEFKRPNDEGGLL